MLAAKNVLLTSEGARAKLADFDSAKRLLHELTEAGLKPLGTRGFASPEVRTGISVEKCTEHRVFFSLDFICTLFCGIPKKRQLEVFRNFEHRRIIFPCKSV